MMKNAAAPQVSIVMGSDSDLPVMEEAGKILEAFGIAFEVRIISAHRSPARTAEYAGGLIGRGVQIVIAGAGHAAHLAGVVAAHTTLPVIGVPIDSSSLQGIDSLLSTVQMPGGIPVATMALGKAGAKNAGLFAAEILALADKNLQKQLVDYRRKLDEGVAAKDSEVRKLR